MNMKKLGIQQKRLIKFMVGHAITETRRWQNVAREYMQVADSLVNRKILVKNKHDQYHLSRKAFDSQEIHNIYRHAL